MKIREKRRTPQATKMFTDRTAPRDAFWNKYNAFAGNLSDGDIRVLTYYGVGGVGKTTLLNKLMEEMEEKLSAPKYIYIDFSAYQNHDHRAVLRTMKNKLLELGLVRRDFSFPLFELGEYIYAQKLGEDPQKPEVRSFADKSPFLGMALAVLENIPTMGVAFKVISLLDQAQSVFRSYLKDHKQELRDIEAKDPLELYELLPYLFAQDLAKSLSSSGTPLVIFLDTYEQLVNETASLGYPLNNDLWLRGEYGLVQNIPGVLWVIAGREKLKWDKAEPEWSDSLDQHILGSLSPTDSDEFLSGARVDDPVLRRQLYTLTNGTPVYLDLCVDRYRYLLEKGHTPQISDFGDNTDKLVERFVRYMDDSKKDLVYALVCMGQWDDEAAHEIAGRALSSFSATAYENVKGLSLVTKGDDGTYTIHQTVSDVLINVCPRHLKLSVAEQGLGYFLKQLSAASVSQPEYSAYLSRIMHFALIRYEDDDELWNFYVDNISTPLRALSAAGKFSQTQRIFAPLWDRARESESILVRVTASRVLAGFFFDRGDYAACAKWAYDSLELCREQLSDDHDCALNAMHTLALALSYLGHHEEALAYQETVLNKMRDRFGEDDPNTLSAMHHMAITLGNLGQHDKSLDYMEAVFTALRERFGEDDPKTLAAMNNLAIALYDSERHEEALACQKILLNKWREQLGEDHPNTLSGMGNLAMTLHSLGRYEEALEYQEMALSKFREILGENHPNTLNSLLHLANTLGCLERYEEALELEQEALDKLRRQLGEEHPYTQTAMSNAAITLTRLERYDEALEYQKILLAQSREHHGEDHPAGAQ